MFLLINCEFNFYEFEFFFRKLVILGFYILFIKFYVLKIYKKCYKFIIK